MARNTKWTKEEILFTLDFYLSVYPSIPAKESKEIRDLSEHLRKIKLISDGVVPADYRNTNGVYMKLMNFHHLNPDHSGKGLAGGSQLDSELFEYYYSRRDELRKLVSLIVNEADQPCESHRIEEVSFPYSDGVQEGRLLSRFHTYRERDSKIVQLKKKSVLKSHGRLICEACSFDFKDVYGERGEGYIHCHHDKPVSQLLPGEKTSLADLRLLCANCHDMIHRSRPWLSVAQLTSLLTK